MTAAGDWEIVAPSVTDAELVAAFAAGDRVAFAAIYDRYADRLHDFCCGILHDRDAAADCVQEVFCIAATRMTQLRDPAKLRPWLYAIARTEALRRIRDRRRETVSDELPDAVCQQAGPETLAARTELANLIDEAAGGLSDRDRSVLELAYRHGLEGADLADALGVSQNSANVIVHRLRETVERALGALLVSRGVRHHPDRCVELAEILDGWDGTFTVLMRKRVARHIEHCAICDEERRRLVNPVALLGTAPVFIPAPSWLRDRTLAEIELASSTGPVRHTDNAKLPVALFVVALVAVLGLTLVWLAQPTTTAIAPAEISRTASPPPVVPVKPVKPVVPVKPAKPVKTNSPTPAPPPAVTAQPAPAAVSPAPVVDDPPPPPPPVVDEPPPVVEDPPPPPPPPLQWPTWVFPQWPALLPPQPPVIVDPPRPPSRNTSPRP
jgi:RNA polymerase sigma factor (sigma-70 family)